jgi:phage regulator Rha-like protein
MAKENKGIVRKDYAMTKEDAIKVKQWNGEIAMSTLRIAEVTGKDHYDILKTCRKIFIELELGEGKYSLSYINGQNKESKHYMLPEFEFNMVISGYSVKYRAVLIKELMDYRKGIKQLTPLEQAQETMKMLDKEIKAEKHENELLNQFIDNTMGDQGLVSFETATKLMYDRFAFSIGRNTLMQCLRDVGVLMENNNPYQRYGHWFKVVKKKSANGNIYNVTLVYEDKIKMIYKYAMKEFD